MKPHAETLWSIVLSDDKGTRFMPVFGGIVTAKTKAEAEKVLGQWREVRCMPTPEAKVVRVKVQTVR
jgi:hypothetical protein